MNVIPLKENISFTQYQKAIQVLKAIGIEVSSEVDTVYLSKQEKKELQKGLDDIEAGRVDTHQQVMNEINELWK